MNASSTPIDDKPDRPAISLVIPVRNGAKTLHACLESVLPLLTSGELREILVVDDGSIDETPSIIASFPSVRCVKGAGEGAAVARNLGVSRACGEFIWFVDADCVVDEGALSVLVKHLEDERVAGAGGTYANGYPNNLLATLIHEEIVARHARMPSEVNHLATYNVIYLKEVFETLGGFDAGSFWAHDVEFAYRVVRAGHVLHFDRQSAVAHFHPTQLLSYLRKQAKQGYYRMRLYALHPGGVGGDSYTSLADSAQPLLACCVFAGSCCLPIASLRTFVIPLLLVASTLLFVACLPMTLTILHRTRRLALLAFLPLAIVRSFFRALGMVAGICCWPHFRQSLLNQT